MRRREFLIGSAIAAGGAGRIWGQSRDKAKLDRIAIMSLCFSRLFRFKGSAQPDDPKRTLDIMDLPDMIAQRYGVHHVEMQHSHFASTQRAYLNEFRARVAKAGSRMNQINVEFGILNISSPDRVLRVEAVDLTRQWIDHAVELHCPRVMVNQGTLDPEVRQDAIAALKTIVEYGKAKKVFVTMENRGGGAGGLGDPGVGPELVGYPSATWEIVVEVLRASGAWANPDSGNFPDEEARRAGLRVMYPMSSGSCHCHYTKLFSEADAVRISKEVEYKGIYSIEAGSHEGPDPYATVQTILDELLRDI